MAKKYYKAKLTVGVPIEAQVWASAVDEQEAEHVIEDFLDKFEAGGWIKDWGKPGGSYYSDAEIYVNPSPEEKPDSGLMRADTDLWFDKQKTSETLELEVSRFGDPEHAVKTFIRMFKDSPTRALRSLANTFPDMPIRFVDALIQGNYTIKENPKNVQIKDTRLD